MFKKNCMNTVLTTVMLIMLISTFMGCNEKSIIFERKEAPLKVQAVQIKEAIMADVIGLKGVLQRQKGFVAVLDAKAEHVKKCKRGLEAMIRIGGQPTAYKGRISQVSQSGDGYHVLVILPQAPASLRSGMPVQGTIYTNAETAALIVPWSAVDRRNGACVWVVDPDTKAKSVPVALRSYDDNIVAISGDVEKDDWVVLAPHIALRDSRDLDVSEIY